MAEVSISIFSQPLSRFERAAKFVVKDSRGRKLGEMAISKGGVRWWSHKEKGAHHMSWAKFDKEMRTRPRQ